MTRTTTKRRDHIRKQCFRRPCACVPHNERLLTDATKWQVSSSRCRKSFDILHAEASFLNENIVIKWCNKFYFCTNDFLYMQTPELQIRFFRLFARCKLSYYKRSAVAEIAAYRSTTRIVKRWGTICHRHDQPALVFVTFDQTLHRAS